MYIRTHDGPGRAARVVAAGSGLGAWAGVGMGQPPAEAFGPDAARNGRPFGLTDDQLKVVLGGLRHAPGAETFFYIHADSSGGDRTFKFGEVRAAPAEVQHQVQFRMEDAVNEAARLTRKARRGAGGAAVSYAPAGLGHSHPQADAGKPSGTDLGHLASIATSTPLVLMTTGTAAMPRPGAVGRPGSPSDKRRELDASVVWRSGYRPVPGGSQLFVPALTMPDPGTYATHQAAAAAARGISPDLVFRYFAGKIVYDGGQFSSEFVEMR